MTLGIRGGSMSFQETGGSSGGREPTPTPEPGSDPEPDAERKH